MRKNYHRVMLSLASNTEQERHLQAAREALTEIMSELRFTSAHWTEPIAAANKKIYLNQLATGTTSLPLEEFNAYLKHIEEMLDREHDKKGIVTIDIDILSYDNIKYHQKDWDRPYVKDLLKEL